MRPFAWPLILAVVIVGDRCELGDSEVNDEVVRPIIVCRAGANIYSLASPHHILILDGLHLRQDTDKSSHTWYFPDCCTGEPNEQRDACLTQDGFTGSPETVEPLRPLS